MSKKSIYSMAGLELHNRSLKYELDQLMAERDRLVTENERLRATLEKIAEDPTGVSSYQQDIARRALKK